MSPQHEEKLSPVKRRLLQQRLRGTCDRGGLLRQIASSPRPLRIPLSSAQQRLWFLDQLEGTSTEYNMVEALRVQGPWDGAALTQAVATIVARHESLRTHFAVVDGEPVQVIAPTVPIALATEDLRGQDAAAQAAGVEAALQRERETPFDLARGPLLRLRVVQLGREAHVVLRTCHHIVSDGWSQGVFNRELSTLYAAYRAGRPVTLPPLAVQYADYALWQRQRLDGATLAEGLAYWTTQLAGVPERLLLPMDRPRPPRQTFTAARCEVGVPPALTAAVREVSRAQQTTSYMTLLTALSVLLARYSGQDDIVVGSPIANRQDAQLEGLIGFFVNRLVLRVRVAPAATFATLLAQVRQTALDAYRHQDVPFERLVEELAPQRQLNVTPLTQIGFALQNAPWVAPHLDGLAVEVIRRDQLRVRTDLEIHVDERPGELSVSWVYSEDLFDRWRIEQLARHYLKVLAALAADPNARVGQIALLDSEERQQIVIGWNQTARVVERPATIVDRFASQVASRPDAVAIASDDEQITFAELDRRAERVASCLGALGVGIETRVGLCVERSAAMVVSLLGVLKAGAAYVPIDPDMPPERRQLLMADAGTPVVLVGSAGASLRHADVAIVNVESEEAIGATPPVIPRRETVAAQAAYVLYTSGSTGQPKGVVVEHRQVVNYVEALHDRLGWQPGIHCAMVQPLSVDSSVTVLFGSLLGGGRLYLMSTDTAADPAAFARYSARHAIECLKIAPSHLAALQEASVRAPLPKRWLVVGGEASRPAWLTTILGQASCEVFNHYGPTETTVGVTMHRIGRHSCAGQTVPIGRPLANVHAYVVDAHLEPLPIGVPGELLIGGDCVARGYLSQPAMTAARFIPDPFDTSGARVYRTGDLARWRPDGELEFLGRTDHQVKVRGFRVELGEIEAALRRAPRVQDALVIAQGESDAQRLLAYVVRPRSDAERAAEQSQHLQKWQQRLEGRASGDAECGDFDTAGSTRSDTQQAQRAEEMRIGVDETVARLRALGPRCVLEVGCGTGSLLTRLATGCDQYIGSDVSATALARLGTSLEGRWDLRHVELRQSPAHALGFVNDDSVDLVVLNSVVQYFPDVDYLLQVLDEAIRVTRPGGHVFVGDVRSLPLLEAYHTSVQLARAADDMPVADLRAQIRRAQQEDDELALDPQLFVELGSRSPKLGRAVVALSGGAHDNDRNRFRYEVTLHVGEKTTATAPIEWVPWDESGRWRALVERHVMTTPNQPIGVRGLRDHRTAAAADAVRRLRVANDRTPAAALRSSSTPPDGDDPAAVMTWARQCGASIHWQRFGCDGVYDLVVNPGWQAGAPAAAQPAAFYDRYANAPARHVSDMEVGRELQESLRHVLPAYMVPAAVMVLAAWPRTRHGKVDRRALPTPDWTAQLAADRAPRTPEEELLCALMADVVGVPSVSPDDDFFALGGHSLLATRLVSRIRATFGVEIAIRTVFESPTVAGIAERLRAAATAARPRLTPQTRPLRIPLSSAQQRLWFLDQLEGTSTEYNMVEALRVQGPWDGAALTQAVATIVARHESLRTHFAVVDGEPVQVIAPTVPIALATEDLRGQDAAAQAAGVEAALQRERETPFDLARGPLLRLRVVQLGREAHVVLRTCHHIVSDGWSQGVFNRELSTLYAAYRAGRPVTLPPLAVQYADYALWQRQWLDGATLAEGLAYWTTQLAGVPERLLLPMDRPRPPRQTFTAARCEVGVPPALTAAVREVSRAQQTTLYMTLLTALSVLLARYSGQDDIVVGSPIANRQDAQLEGLIGFFVNTLVLRVRVAPAATFATLLAQVRQTALDAYRHQDVPFERLVEELAPQRTLSAPPLFQVMLLVQNAPRDGQQLAGATVEPVRGAALRVRYDLEVHVWERDGALAVGWLYNDQLFDRWRIEQLGRHYGRVLEALANDPQGAVDAVALLTAAERAAVLTPWTAARAAAPAVVPPVVRQWGPRAGTDAATAVALACGAQTLTYAALRTQAHRIGHALRAAPTAAGDMVGVVTDDRMAMAVAIVGTLEAGWGFAPLDPGLPDERLRALVAQCAPRALLADEQWVERVRAWTTAPVLALETCRADGRHDGAALPAADWAAAPCYLYFTSGSTGTPKGVAGRLTSLEHFIAWEIAALQLDATVRVSQLTRPGFDPYLRELFVALSTGGTLCLPPDPDLMTDGPRLVPWLAAAEVTVLHCVPTVLRILLAHAAGQLPRLRYVLSAGEPLLPADVQRWAEVLPHTQLLNLYGPTETTLAKLAHWVTAADGARAVVPIGRPLPGAAAVVLDRQDEVCPLGVVGEIGLWTPYASFGYYRQPAWTAAAFVPHALGSLPGDRLYRTGDLGRLLPDGTVECLGRRDGQVKIRGNRVELGEIETALLAQPGVRHVAVVARDGPDDERRLVAYVVGEGDARTWRTVLQQRLPAYMVPSAFVSLDALPLTRHGKVDRRALPTPDWTAQLAADRAPRTPEEELLCALMADVVGVPSVSPDDDFFALGGHSLLATRLVSRIRATFGVEIAIRTVFESPTVAGIAERLRAAATAARPRLTPQTRPLRIPLSSAQQRLWFLDQLEGTSTEYNMVEALRVQGPWDGAALTQAVATIVARHESLRTHFAVVDGEPVQVIAPTVPIALATEDLRGQDAAAQAAGVEAALQRERETPFDLARGPLLRLRVVQLGREAHVVLRTCHHIVSDGWSQGVFNRELSTLYAAYRAGRPVTLPPLAVQYADYALWQRQWLDGATLAEGLAYWTTQLAGVPERLLLPMDRPRPPRQTFTAARCEVGVPPALTAAVREVSRAQQTTLYMTLLTALSVLLARYSGQDDIVVGSPIANRQDAQLEGLIGFFVNTLVLRVRVAPAATFATLLAQVRQTALDAYRHQDVPFERLVEELAPQRTLSAPPLFQVMLLVQNAPRDGQQLAGATVEPVRGAALRVRYDLEVHVWERDGALAVGWLYNDQLFDRWRIEQLGRHYGRVLEALANDPQGAVDAVALLTAAERAAVLTPWTAARAAAPAVVPPVVRQWGPRAGTDAATAVALACGAQTLTYAALRTQAHRIGHALRAAPTAAGDMVGVVTDDRMAMAVAIVGTLEAGWGFAPLDPGLPDERLRALVAQCAPRALLADEQWVERVRAWTTAPVLALETCRADGRHDGAALPAADWAAAPCYLYFTSGSTGTPKGVAGRLTSLEHFIAWEIAALQLDATVRVSQLTRPGFDPYLRELFVALSTGGTLCLPPDPDLMTDGPRLVPWLAAAEVTVLHCVPTVLRILLAHAAGQLPRLRYVLSAGEPLLPADVQRWAEVLPHTQLLNLYGPTETTLAKLAHWVTAADGARAVVPIGRPLPGAAAVVLDRQDEVCPLGVVGEIGLWTPYASFGYYRQPAWTAAAFVPHALGSLPGDRLYRTGDLGRLLPDGTVECLGRRDGQVKIRGNRVELGEIETALLAQPGVRHVAVVARDGPDDERRLVAYVVGEGDARTWRTVLQQRLPAYMVPSAFVSLDALPLTRHGKVDRRALPTPDWTAQLAADRAPRTPEEELLCALMADVVGVPSVSPDDDFFALGGHSLLAMHLISRIRAALGADLSIHHVFETPRVCDIADRIQSQTREPSDPPILPLRPTGDLPPLFCITAHRGMSVSLGGLMRFIARGHPIYALDAARLRAASTLPPFEQAAADCLARIREIQPAGPYQLFGGFDGGPIAHKIACALRRDGEEVALLAMLDSRPEPRSTKETTADGTVPQTFDGDLLFVASNGSDPHDACVPDAWIPYISGRIKVSWIGATSPGTHWSECCQEVGSVLAREIAALA